MKLWIGWCSIDTITWISQDTLGKVLGQRFLKKVNKESSDYQCSGKCEDWGEIKLFQVLKERTDYAELQLGKAWEKEFSTERCKKWAYRKKSAGVITRAFAILLIGTV